jgi:hypothetical protein
MNKTEPLTPAEEAAKQVEFDAGADFAEREFEHMCEACEAAGLDSDGVAHSLFVILARYLTEAGWPTDGIRPIRDRKVARNGRSEETQQSQLRR